MAQEEPAEILVMISDGIGPIKTLITAYRIPNQPDSPLFRDPSCTDPFRPGELVTVGFYQSPLFPQAILAKWDYVLGRYI